MFRLVVRITLIGVLLVLSWSCSRPIRSNEQRPVLLISPGERQGSIKFVDHLIYDGDGIPDPPEGYRPLGHFGSTMGEEQLVLFFDVPSVSKSEFDTDSLLVTLDLGEKGLHRLPFMSYASQSLIAVSVSDIYIAPTGKNSVSIKGEDGVSTVFFEEFGRDLEREEISFSNISFSNLEFSAVAKRYLPEEEREAAVTGIEISSHSKSKDIITRIIGVYAYSDIQYKDKPLTICMISSATGFSDIGVALTGPLVIHSNTLMAEVNYRTMNISGEHTVRLKKSGSDFVMELPELKVTLKSDGESLDYWFVTLSSEGATTAYSVIVHWPDGTSSDILLQVGDDGRSYIKREQLDSALNQDMKVISLDWLSEGLITVSAPVQNVDEIFTTSPSFRYEAAGTIIYTPEVQ